MGGVEREVERLGRNLRGLEPVQARGSDLGCDLILEAAQCRACGLPFKAGAQTSYFFEEPVDGCA